MYCGRGGRLGRILYCNTDGVLQLVWLELGCNTKYCIVARQLGTLGAAGARARALGSAGTCAGALGAGRGLRAWRGARGARRQAQARCRRVGAGRRGQGRGAQGSRTGARRAGWPRAVHSVHLACFWLDLTRYFS